MKTRAALWPPLLWLLAAVVVPTALIVGTSFRARGPGGLVDAFTLDAWRSMVSSDVLTLLVRSTIVATVATACTLVIAYPVAYFIAGCGARVRPILLALVVLPFWTNFLARTTAMRLIFYWCAGPEFYSTTAVVIGLVYSYLPFMVLPLYVSIEKVPRRLLEAAADLGASPARTFWSVTVPLTAPGIAAGCILVYIPCFGAFVTPRVLGRSGLVGTQIDVLVRTGDWPGASALSLVMMGGVLVLLSVYYRFRKGEGIV